MSVLIVACGNTGVTLKAAKILSTMIGAEAISAKEKIIEADTYVLGTNVRFGKFNKKFLKLVKKLIKKGKKIYVFICGAEIERSQYYIDKAYDTVPCAEEIKYVWGELNALDASKIDKFFIETFIDGRKKDGLPKPRLLTKEIRALADAIDKNENMEANQTE